ncbi:hypothetical protein [Streptomyces sp. NRRL S-350]|uniref:hypothetical protein n=1 Tax=Streptomyces sp. NRRL S-350 TaxID=1463902 RepID=UPI0004C00C6F|nr:hypothetical protein [Streptomyces sp. NRRL S-350]
MEALRAELYALVRDAQPCTVRHVYYLGLGLLWEKDTGKSRRNYSVPVRELGYMREHGLLPWEWITDGTRLVRQEMQYDSMLDALERTTATYRRNLWASQPRRVEVWCESDSVSGVLLPVTTKWGVGLYSCRGQSSKTFVWEAVRQNQAHGKPLTVLYAGDWDPSGRAVPRSVVERIERYGNNGIDLDFRQIAVTAGDVRGGRLVSHEANTADSNFKRFREECLHEGLDPYEAVEVEALSPGTLRTRLDAAIEQQVRDVHQWNVLARAEQHDRSMLLGVQEALESHLRHRQTPDDGT